MRSAFFLLVNRALSSRISILALLALLLLVAGATQGNAQNIILSVSTPTNFVTVNSSVLFTINVTNRAGFLLDNVSVTNSLTGTATTQITSVTNSLGSSFFNSPTNVAFSLGQIIDGGIARMDVAVQPTSGGTFTNFVILMVNTSTNTFFTNIAVVVAPPNADLAVSLTPPATPIVVNDLLTYRVAVTNLGTNSVANVVLTNRDFSSMILKSLSPTNAFSRTNGQIYFNLGTLAGRAGKTYTITAQPTNAGPLTLAAFVTATNTSEQNATNNFSGTNLTVGQFITGNLIATNASAMVLNRQSGLLEQKVRLVNVSTSSVAAARVMVSGLGTNVLRNAVGTNNGNPFVVYSAPLEAGAGVDLLMEYRNSARTNFDIPNSAYTAIGTEAINLSVSGTPGVPITLWTNLGSAGFLIEFETVIGSSYTIFYSNDASFTNVLTAQPSVLATANRTQWIDNGPPKTASHPSNLGSRFYFVRVNP